MWWIRRKPGRWVANCRDVTGRRRQILVVPTDSDLIALIVPRGDVAMLEPLGAGRLVGALRDAVRALDDPNTRQTHQHAIPITQSCRTNPLVQNAALIAETTSAASPGSSGLPVKALLLSAELIDQLGTLKHLHEVRP